MKANYVAIILYDKSHNLFEAWPSYALESKPLENNFVSDWEIFTCMYRCRKHLLPKIRYKAPNKPPINSTTIGYIIQMNVIYHWLPSTLCMYIYSNVFIKSSSMTGISGWSFGVLFAALGDGHSWCSFL